MGQDQDTAGEEQSSEVFHSACSDDLNAAETEVLAPWEDLVLRRIMPLQSRQGGTVTRVTVTGNKRGGFDVDVETRYEITYLPLGPENGWTDGLDHMLSPVTVNSLAEMLVERDTFRNVGEVLARNKAGNIQVPDASPEEIAEHLRQSIHTMQEEDAKAAWDD